RHFGSQFRIPTWPTTPAFLTSSRRFKRDSLRFPAFPQLASQVPCPWTETVGLIMSSQQIALTPKARLLRSGISYSCRLDISALWAFRSSLVVISLGRIHITKLLLRSSRRISPANIGAPPPKRSASA